MTETKTQTADEIRNEICAAIVGIAQRDPGGNPDQIGAWLIEQVVEARATRNAAQAESTRNVELRRQAETELDAAQDELVRTAEMVVEANQRSVAARAQGVREGLEQAAGVRETALLAVEAAIHTLPTWGPSKDYKGCMVPHGVYFEASRVWDAVRALRLSPPAQAASPWQPIETAPKDGTPVLAWYVRRVHWREDPEEDVGAAVASWTVHNGGGWVSYSLGRPTHWTPLPAPPADKEGK
jgi:nucleoid-associated protein YgaU